MPKEGNRSEAREDGGSPHGSAEFLVGHAGVVLDGAPEAGQVLALDDAEDALVDVLPAHHARAVLGFVQQVADELPQFAVAAAVCCAESVNVNIIKPPLHHQKNEIFDEVK